MAATVEVTMSSFFDDVCDSVSLNITDDVGFEAVECVSAVKERVEIVEIIRSVVDICVVVLLNLTVDVRLKVAELVSTVEGRVEFVGWISSVVNICTVVLLDFIEDVPLTVVEIVKAIVDEDSTEFSLAPTNTA